MTRADGSFGISLRPNISGIVLPIVRFFWAGGFPWPVPPEPPLRRLILHVNLWLPRRSLHACLKKLLRPAVIDIAVDAFARAQFSNTVLTWKALQDNTDLNLLLNNDAGWLYGCLEPSSLRFFCLSSSSPLWVNDELKPPLRQSDYSVQLPLTGYSFVCGMLFSTNGLSIAQSEGSGHKWYVTVCCIYWELPSVCRSEGG